MVTVRRKQGPQLYTVYFDESGTHPDSDAAVVVDFVSNATKWAAFSEDWRQVLRDAGLEYFRMSLIENRQGPFADWAEDVKRDLLNRLLPIIKRHTFTSVGCVVKREWMDSHLSEFAQEICGDACGLAALSCFRHLGLRMQENDGWIDGIMESCASGSGALQLLFEEDSKITEWQEAHRINSMVFAEKREHPPLQAADILAYELYKHGLRKFRQEDRNARYPLRELASQRHQWVYLQEQDFIDLDNDLTAQLLARSKQP